MEEDHATTNNHPLEALAFGLVWAFGKLAVKFLWNLALAIFASIVAGLILLVGVSTVLGVGVFSLGLILLLIKTAVSLVVAFVLSLAVAVVILFAFARAARFLATRYITINGWRRWFRWPLTRLQIIVVRLREYARATPESELLEAFTGLLLLMTATLLVLYLQIWGLASWNQIRRARLPSAIPVEQVGRSLTPRIFTVEEAAKYTRARSGKVAAKTRMIALGTHRLDPLPSRCGTVPAPLPPEMHQIAELLVDLTEAPPMTKREYVLTEDQLSAVISAFLKAHATQDTLDCIKLHQGSIKVFTTTVEADGTRQNQAVGLSVGKKAGRLRIVLEELSIGRGSFQLGWLGFGVVGDGSNFFGDGDTSASIRQKLRELDSRIFNIDVHEGYIRIVTWRLPSIVAARAADTLGRVRVTTEHRVAPREDAASLGNLGPNDVIYVLENTNHWIYACSEVSGRCGWLPDAVFVSLEDDQQLGGST